MAPDGTLPYCAANALTMTRSTRILRLILMRKTFFIWRSLPECSHMHKQWPSTQIGGNKLRRIPNKISHLNLNKPLNNFFNHNIRFL